MTSSRPLGSMVPLFYKYLRKYHTIMKIRIVTSFVTTNVLVSEFFRFFKILWKYLPTKKKHKHLKELWLNKIKRKEGTLPKERNIAPCSEHFTSDCFERDLKKEFELQTGEIVYKIKEDAVPTIFVFMNNQTAKRESSENRVKRAEKRKIIDNAYYSAAVSSSRATTTSMFSENNEPCFSDSSPIVFDQSSRTTKEGSNTSDLETHREVSINTDVTFSPYIF